MPAIVLRVFANSEGAAGLGKFPDKGFQLLAFLALMPARRASRRQLADLLWDSPDDATALGNLRQLLSRLRRNADVAGMIGADASSVWLEADAGLDLSVFLDLMRTGRLEETLKALDLYRGDLLADPIDFSSGFAEWIRGARVQVRDMFFTGASKVLMELTRFGNADPEALRAVERKLLGGDREREASYRALIEAYGRNGMTEDVVRLYARLESLMKAELQTQVSSETRAVFRRATAGRSGITLLRPRPEFDLVRVAFLPLKLLGHGNEGLIGALFDDVANNLARYRTLTVLAIHSSFRREMPEEIRNVALDADYHISGFVLPDGISLSLNMQEVRTAKIVWAADYSLAPAELAATFRMLSRQVAASLADAIEHRRVLASTQQPSPPAYHAFLQGKMQLASVDLPQLRRARSAFRAAADEQAHYAAAHARLAQTLYLEWLLLGGNDPQILVNARQEADDAIGYDPGGAEGYWMRGVVSLYQRDFDGSAEHFATAESLGPHSADLLVQYADALSHLGQPREGWLRFERALQLNPLPPDHYWWAGASIAFVEERYDAVIELCGRMDSDVPAIRLLASTHALAGNLPAAKEYGRRVRETYPGFSREMIGRLVPSKDPATVARYVEGLRMAGVA